MPVTAKLSRRFYDALGDEVANELVEWFNAVDLTWRTELRELNEANHARFDAKLAEGLAGLRAELKEGLALLRAELKEELATLRGELGGLRSEFKQDLATHRMTTEAAIAQLRVDLALQKADLVRWMFLFWLGTVAVSLASRLL